MCKTCHNHNHNEFTKEQFDLAVEKFLKDLPENISIEEEYQKILNKKSELSRSQRDTIIAIVEYKKEHFE